MSRGPRISNTVRRVIAEEALKDRSYPRAAVAAKLQDIIERMGEVVPQEETLVKMISHARKHEPSPLDAPWSLGTLPDYPIPAAALPTVLQVHEMQRITREYPPPEIRPYLTIRQALWIARLHPLFVDTTRCLSHALSYAAAERACEVSGTPFDSTSLDRMIVHILSEQIGKALGIPADHVSPPITRIEVHDPSNSTVVKTIHLGQCQREQEGTDG